MEQERIEALKANDMEAYGKLLKQTHNDRCISIQRHKFYLSITLLTCVYDNLYYIFFSEFFRLKYLLSQTDEYLNKISSLVTQVNTFNTFI